MELRPARLIAPVAVGLLAGGMAASAQAKPAHVSGVRCVRDCAGLHAGAPGSTLQWNGRHLSHVAKVRFPSGSGEVEPTHASKHEVLARIPAGAKGGRPSLITPGRPKAFAKAPVHVVKRGALVPHGTFRLGHSKAHPHRAFFDGKRLRIHFRYVARSVGAVKINIVRRSTGGVVAHAVRPHETPFSPHTFTWNGVTDSGSVAPAGSYAFRIGPIGKHGETGASFTMLPFEFPVRGPHSYGGPVQRFGAPRSGGRVHQGQDVFSPCGTREVAARGGVVQAAGYDPVLYGYWLVIDGRRTSTDYRYVHLIAPTPLHLGEHVRTGQTVGHVGRTGNARTVGCMLHLEEWPQGWEHGNPVDPLPDLQLWDGWS